ncbi:MAG: F0F1 ATP synthase subunit A, partial [Hyphomicrobiaceae bacterium]
MAAAQGAGMPDPIRQFDIHTLVPLRIGGVDASFTNSALFMLIAVGLIIGFLTLSMRGRSLVPTRHQSMAEMTYEFLADMLRESAGEAGMKYFPLVFSLFAFIFTVNMLGMIPGAFTVTSHIVVTAALAALVFVTVLAVGFAKHGLHFFRLFVPQGVPAWILPAVVIIEVIS